jgi:Ca2+-binding RTX toxin-like protein
LQQVIGGSANDTLDASAFSGAVALTGGEGDDSLVVSTGDNLRSQNVQGGSGTDTLSFAIDQLSVTDADFVGVGAVQVLKTANGNNRIILGANAQTAGIATVVGGTGNDTINASAFTTALTLDGGAGSNSLIGGTGNDFYVISSNGNQFVDAGGIDTVASSATQTTLTSDIENLVFNGAGAATLTGNSLANSIIGNTGSQTLDGAGGNDTIDGGTDADSLFGGSGADSIIGGAGQDTLNATGDTDTDTLVGGADNDVYIVDGTSDIIVEDGTGGAADAVHSKTDYDLGSNLEVLYLGSGTFNAALNGGRGGYSDTATLSAYGNSLDNLIIGNAGDNALDGLVGNDTMIGGAGNDTYYVGEAGDWVFESLAGESNYVIKAVGVGAWTNLSTLAGGTVTITTLASNSLGGGNNTDSGTPLNDTIYGEGGNDSISGGKGSDILYGGSDNDTLIGGLGVDTLLGESGDDSLIGGEGVDSLVGGTGNDTYVIDVATVDYISETYQSSGGTADQIQVNGSFSIADPAPLPIGVNAPGIYAGIEELVYSGTSSVSLTGNKLRNTITSGSGADYLDGGTGKDTLIGGAGNDTYTYEDQDYIVEESVGGGTDEVRSANDIDLSAIQNIENIVLTGSLGIGATGNSSDNSIVGNTASNPLSGAGGDDTLLGLDGDDILSAGDGKNSLVGGSGNDTYIIEATENSDGSVTIQDILVEEANGGADEIRVAADVDLSQLPDFENVRLTGSGNFNVIGNASNNTIVGNTGDNILDGGLGGDDLRGGIGDDTYYVDDAADNVIENAGEGLADMVISSSQSYTLSGNFENLKLISGSGSAGYGNTDPNLLIGSAGANSLFGDQGDDTIVAGLGADYLDGGFGIDSMVGGLGDDTYVVEGGFDTILEAFTADIDVVIMRPRVGAGIVNEGLGIFDPDVKSITFDVPTGTVVGGGAELFLDFNTLKDGELNFQDYAPRPLTGGNVSKNPNYFYVLAENIYKLTIENSFVPINGLIYAESSNQPDYVYGNSLANYIAVSGEGLLSNGALVAFDNYIDGQGGTDTMAGGFGNDYYIVDNAGDVVLEASGQGTDTVRSSDTYTLSGNVEVLQLADVTETIVDSRPVTNILSGGALNFHGTGNAGNNSLFGNAGNNSLIGLDGNDYLVGGNGLDTMLGGKGNDTYYITATDSSDVVVESATEGEDLVVTNLTSYSLSNNVERLSYNGSNGASLVGNSIANTINGANGSDTLLGDSGADSLFGGFGNDFLLGGEGNDTLEGADGNDTLDAGQGDDTLFGGAGIDSLVANDGDDVLDGGAGIDTMVGGKGNDTYYVSDDDEWILETEATGAGVNYIIRQDNVSSYNTLAGGDATFVGGLLEEQVGTSGNDSLVGTPLRDTISGNGGNDTITGANGADSLLGGADNDSISGGDGSDSILGDAGNDTLLGDAGSDSIWGGADNDSILGGADNDTLLGDAGNDTIFGDAGNDSIFGGADSDSLIAGTGSDTLLGEAGKDTLVADATGTASLLGGNDSDSFVFSSGAQVLANTVVGGAGTAGDSGSGG